MGFAVLISVAATPHACSERVERPRSAVLIVLDTLRADRTSVYGGPRRTTPALERLAGEGVVFEQTVTNSTWTLPAMAALLGGRYVDAALIRRRLQSSLVERLREAGLRTAAFTEGGFVSARFGFDRGFDEFAEQRFVSPLQGPCPSCPDEAHEEIEVTFERALAWLEDVGDEPFFLLVHTYEPHTPYDRQTYLEGLDPDGLPPRFGILGAAFVKRAGNPLSAARLEYIRALYDGGVAESDRWVGRLLDALERLGLADETLVVVTSDHGEDLGDRDPPMPGNHGHSVYDEQALVPLIVRDPTERFPVARVAAQVRTIDTMPTILDRLGVEQPSEGGGRSLVPLMRGEESAHRPAWLRVERDSPNESISFYGLRTGVRKLIVDGSGDAGARVSLFDLDSDPGERVDLAADLPDEVERLRAALDATRARLEAHGPARLRVDAEEAGEQADQLRALGYIE